MKIRIILARIKRRLLKKPYEKDPKFPAYWFNQVLGNREAQIVQIGSNDGKTGDPLNTLLHKHKKWKGVFVEPVPYLFEKLKENYKDSSRFSFENVAINEGETLEFYWVDPAARDILKNLPYWYDQLGSFNRNHISKQLDGKLEPFILSTELEGIKLLDLFNRNKLKNVNLLHIDTEGYDWNILSQLNLNQYSPEFILFESNHLSKTDLIDSYNFLEKKYVIFDSGIDILAVNKSIGEGHMKKMTNHLQRIEIDQFS